ncbi:hypothetical protein WDU94_013963 [Cyamophila willieti]
MNSQSSSKSTARDMRSKKFRNIKSRYLNTSKANPNDSSENESKCYEDMTCKELKDEFYSLAIKKREDTMFEVHKEVCKKYEETIADQYKKIQDLENDNIAMDGRIRNDGVRIKDLLSDHDEQVAELERKLGESTQEVNKLNKKLKNFIDKEKTNLECIKHLENEKRELKVTVEALLGTIEELKSVNLNLTNNQKYKLHYDSDSGESYSMIDLTENTQAFPSRKRKSLAFELQEKTLEVREEDSMTEEHNISNNNSPTNENDPESNHLGLAATASPKPQDKETKQRTTPNQSGKTIPPPNSPEIQIYVAKETRLSPISDKYVNHTQLLCDKDYATQIKLRELEESVNSNIMRISKLENISMTHKTPTTFPAYKKPIEPVQEKEIDEKVTTKSYERILLFGDSHTRDTQHILNQNIPTNCRANVICLPGKTLDNVVNSINPQKLDKKTLVCVLAGTNDVFKTPMRDIENALDKLGGLPPWTLPPPPLPAHHFGIELPPQNLYRYTPQRPAHSVPMYNQNLPYTDLLSPPPPHQHSISNQSFMHPMTNLVR